MFCQNPLCVSPGVAIRSLQPPSPVASYSYHQTKKNTLWGPISSMVQHTIALSLKVSNVNVAVKISATTVACGEPSGSVTNTFGISRHHCPAQGFAMGSLFRKEVLHARRGQWLGPINLATPLSFVWWALLATAFT